MLRRDRKRHHRRIAETLQQSFAALCAGQPQLPARHLTEGGRDAEAIPLWLEAGRQAQPQRAGPEILPSMGGNQYQATILVEI